VLAPLGAETRTFGALVAGVVVGTCRMTASRVVCLEVCKMQSHLVEPSRPAVEKFGLPACTALEPRYSTAQIVGMLS
jgi:hypothetical protein